MRRMLAASGTALLAACLASCGDVGTARADPGAARVQAFTFSVEVAAEGVSYPFKSCTVRLPALVANSSRKRSSRGRESATLAASVCGQA